MIFYLQSLSFNILRFQTRIVKIVITELETKQNIVSRSHRWRNKPQLTMNIPLRMRKVMITVVCWSTTDTWFVAKSIGFRYFYQRATCIVLSSHLWQVYRIFTMRIVNVVKCEHCLDRRNRLSSVNVFCCCLFVCGFARYLWAGTHDFFQHALKLKVISCPGPLS